MTLESNFKKCENCHGTGEVRCNNCEGKGYNLIRRSGYDSSGSYSSEQEKERCTTCHGSGNKMCTTCGGTGKQISYQSL
jgi:DnaJ-class molecular chaperone